jgi:hypothetical protein
VPLLPTAMMFSRRPTYSEWAKSSTSDLLSERIAANSKPSRLLTAGNLASLIRRSTILVPFDHLQLGVAFVWNRFGEAPQPLCGADIDGCLR